MDSCSCRDLHQGWRIAVTGGPGAGKTAILSLLKHCFCSHVIQLPEAASMLFGAGLPRKPWPEARRATQKAIFHAQRALEESVSEPRAALVLCDRGTVDGAAFWPDGPASFFEAMGTTCAGEMGRYHSVVHLRTPSAANGGYDHANPIRIETQAEAAAIDDRLAQLWAAHPRKYEVPASPDFLDKAASTLAILRAVVPACCRGAVRLPSQSAA